MNNTNFIDEFGTCQLLKIDEARATGSLSLLLEYMRHQSDMHSLKKACESLRCSISSTERKVLVLMSKAKSPIFALSWVNLFNEDESRLKQVQSRRNKMSG